MSGSRAVLLKLSVQDASVVREQLTQMGAAGEAALARLDAAARRVGAGGGAGGGASGGSFGGLRNAVGQAGFQIQDFAVQVQGGTSALTAFSQQGSQLLGIFGPGGAAAGALLTVGILIARFIEFGEQSERTRQALERVREATTLYGQAMQQSNDIMLTAEQRSAAQEQAKQAEARATLDLAMVIERETIARANAAAVRLQGDNAAIAGAARDGLAAPPMFQRGGQRLNAAQQIAQDAEQAGQRLLALEERLRNLNNAGVNRGNGAQGPDAPPGRPTGGGGRANGDGGRGFLQMLRDQQEWEQNQGKPTEDAIARIGNEVKRTTDYTRELGLTFNSAFEDAIVRGNSFRSVLDGIISDLARMAIRKTVTEPLGNAIGSLFGSGAGVAGSGGIIPEAGGGGGIFGSLISAGLSLFGGGFKAEGGPVSANTPYIVGERGMELFVPNAAGNIVPNHAMGGGGGGQVVNFSMNIDARGATPDAVAMLRAQIPALAKAAVEDAARRGGGFARSVRGR